MRDRDVVQVFDEAGRHCVLGVLCIVYYVWCVTLVESWVWVAIISVSCLEVERVAEGRLVGSGERIKSVVKDVR